MLTLTGAGRGVPTVASGGGSSLPVAEDGLVLFLEADDTDTLFQTVAGTTAPADGSPIGTWQDKSGAGNHLTAAADDTARPTYRTNGGLPYLEFDGSNDVLRRLASFNLAASGGTVLLAMRSASPAASAIPFSEGLSSNATLRYYSVNSGGDAATTIRTGEGSYLLNTVTLYGAAFDGLDRVFGFADSNTQVEGYLVGTASGAPDAITKSGTLTTDRFAIGALWRASPANWFAMRVYAVAVWDRILTSGEMGTAVAYLATKQGRTL